MVRGVARHRHPAAMWRLCNDARVGTNHHDVLRVSTPDNVAIGYDVAGLGSRFIAQLLDTLIVGVLLLVVSVSVAAALGSSDSQGSVLVALAVGGASLFTYIGYFTLCELTTGGRTPGKSAGGARVPPPPPRAGLDPPLRARLALDMTTRLLDHMQLPVTAPERTWPPELLLERLYMQLQARTAR